jgi:hypothetical protein
MRESSQFGSQDTCRKVSKEIDIKELGVMAGIWGAADEDRAADDGGAVKKFSAIMEQIVTGSKAQGLR